MPLESSVAIGFLRLVQVRAATPVDAEVRAVELIRSDWAASAYASRNLGGAPYLTVSRIGLLSWWHRLLGAPRGYLFFGDDGIHVPSRDR